jgi:DNA mismatch endonuclease, patch repair protein
MADYPKASSAGRSANMRAIRRTDTQPELALRRALHRMGYRFRKDYRLDLAAGKRVRPDIAFTARKVAVFVDGCFWHACPDHGSRPSVNQGYWAPKLLRNVERDRAADSALELAGWQVVRLWEHEPLAGAVATVVAALGTPGPDPAPDTPGPDPAPDTPGPDPQQRHERHEAQERHQRGQKNSEDAGPPADLSHS